MAGGLPDPSPSPSPTAPGGGGGVVGDPRIHTIWGEVIEFTGEPGSSYLALSDGVLSVAFRVAGIDQVAGKTFLDQVSISISGTRVVVDLESASLNGVPLAFDGPWVGEDFRVRYWRGAGGERRVDVSFGEWRVAVLQDDGSSLLLHGGGPLDGVAHLGLFVDSHPGVNLGGLIVEGSAGCDPSSFLVIE